MVRQTYPKCFASAAMIEPNTSGVSERLKSDLNEAGGMICVCACAVNGSQYEDKAYNTPLDTEQRVPGDPEEHANSSQTQMLSWEAPSEPQA